MTDIFGNPPAYPADLLSTEDPQRHPKDTAQVNAAEIVHANSDSAHPRDPEVLDPAYHAQPHRGFLYDTERIDPCAKNNLLMQSLIAPMPGLHFGTIVTLVDDNTFQTANLLDALPEVDQDADGDLDMDSDEEDNGMDEMERMEQAVNPDNDWGKVLIL